MRERGEEALALAGLRGIAQYFAGSIACDAVAAREHRGGIKSRKRRLQALELRRAAVHAMAERKSEARAQLHERLPGVAQGLRGMHQALGAAVERLRRVLQPPAHLAREAAYAFLQLPQKIKSRRRRELGGRGGRRRAAVGGEIGDREVALVTDADQHRNG